MSPRTIHTHARLDGRDRAVCGAVGGSSRPDAPVSCPKCQRVERGRKKPTEMCQGHGATCACEHVRALILRGAPDTNRRTPWDDLADAARAVVNAGHVCTEPYEACALCKGEALLIAALAGVDR